MQTARDAAAAPPDHSAPGGAKEGDECMPMPQHNDPRDHPSGALPEGYAAAWSYRERCWYAVARSSGYWCDPRRDRCASGSSPATADELDPAACFPPPRVSATTDPPRPGLPEAGEEKEKEKEEYIELPQHDDPRTYPRNYISEEYCLAWSDEKECWFGIRRTSGYWSDPRRPVTGPLSWRVPDPAAYFLRLRNPVTGQEPKVLILSLLFPFRLSSLLPLSPFPFSPFPLSLLLPPLSLSLSACACVLLGKRIAVCLTVVTIQTPPTQDLWQLKAVLDEWCSTGKEMFPRYASHYTRDPSPPFWGDQFSIEFAPRTCTCDRTRPELVIFQLDPPRAQYGEPRLLEPDPTGDGHLLFMYISASDAGQRGEIAVLRQRVTEICRQFRWGLKCPD